MAVLRVLDQRNRHDEQRHEQSLQCSTVTADARDTIFTTTSSSIRSEPSAILLQKYERLYTVFQVYARSTVYVHTLTSGIHSSAIKKTSSDHSAEDQKWRWRRIRSGHGAVLGLLQTATFIQIPPISPKLGAFWLETRLAKLSSTNLDQMTISAR